MNNSHETELSSFSSKLTTLAGFNVESAESHKEAPDAGNEINTLLLDQILDEINNLWDEFKILSKAVENKG